ncbi:MAG: sugar phosphate isomerase/epimerase [Bacteroidetes bacterium]|nr:sugar phosphate isomerase/epimerase [Bacteroidota bacterium]MDA1122064.1 sugar phosphate isomerase/epimerase [Bacteroidota bacterium]
MNNSFPKLHNATWPGVVGKGEDEPFISLDKMMELTAKAEVNGRKFDGVDLFLSEPHVSIDSTDDQLKALVEQLNGYDLVAGSIVAPVWPETGGGSAMGSVQDKQKFLTQVRKACEIGGKLRDLGVRPYGIVRIDSATDVGTWSKDPDGNTKLIAQTFKEAAIIASDHGEKLAAEGEICWGGMHSWKWMLRTLELADSGDNLGFQADLAHSMLYLLGFNAEEHRLLPKNFDWEDKATFTKAYTEMTDALRPWTIDFHVAQNDGTVKGQGSHNKTGKHCLADDPNGKLDIPQAAGFWLTENGQPRKNIRHICWDGCMFPNETLHQQQTWNTILGAMISVQDAHGWSE